MIIFSVNTLLLGIALENETGKTFRPIWKKKYGSRLVWNIQQVGALTVVKITPLKLFAALMPVHRTLHVLADYTLIKEIGTGYRLFLMKWVIQSTSIVNDSRDSQGYPYTYQWRISAKGSFFAKGILGQYIFIDPKKNIIIVRMGTGNGDVDLALFL